MNGRLEAANLLRAIRSVGIDRAGDLLDWAMTLLPDSPVVQRLHARALINADDKNAADSVIARAMLIRPKSASLQLLRAQCLMARHRWDDAAQVCDQALQLRPHHRETRLLAARIDLQRNAHGTAVRLIERAPYALNEQFKAMLVEALLGVEDVQRAQWMLDSMDAPPLPLQALLLNAQGRILDAADVYEQAIAQQPVNVDALLDALLVVLEKIGDVDRLDRAMKRVQSHHGRARIRLAQILLSQGRFRAAALAAAAMRRQPAHRVAALSVLTVAASLLGRQRLAGRALGRLRATPQGICPHFMACCWQRGMLGKLLRNQHSAHEAGCDPGFSVLQALLRDARGETECIKKSRRIRDSAGGVAQKSERENVLVSSPVEC